MTTIYASVDQTCLCQCEIIENLIDYKLSIDSHDATETELYNTSVARDLSIVITQACDLEQDYWARNNQNAADKQLDYVLFCEVVTADRIRDTNGLKSSELESIRKKFRPRYHHIVDSCIDGTDKQYPEYFVDFKRVFAIPTAIVYWQLTPEMRRCRLVSPFQEDFIHRLHYYHGRVPLPNTQDSVEQTSTVRSLPSP